MFPIIVFVVLGALALVAQRRPAAARSGSPQAPPAGTTPPPEPAPARFALGQRVRHVDGREGQVVAREFGKFQAGHWHYLLEGSSTWLREDTLSAVADTPPPPEPKAPAAPSGPARYVIGDPVETSDGRTGAVSAARWEPFLETWVYQVGGWSTWYRERDLTPPTPQPVAIPPSPAPVLPGTNQPAIRPGAVLGRVFVLNEVAWRNSTAQQELDLAARRFADVRRELLAPGGTIDSVNVRGAPAAALSPLPGNETWMANTVTAVRSLFSWQVNLQDARNNLGRAQRGVGESTTPAQRAGWEAEVQKHEQRVRAIELILREGEATVQGLRRLVDPQYNTERAIIASQVGVALNTQDAINRFAASTGGYRDSL